jgi:cytochrome P450
MITTREFVNVAAWHLFTNSALLARYCFAEEADRLAILQEILRLEPVVGRLRRRTTTSIEVPGAEGVVTVPAGELVEIVLGVANADPKAMGTQPLAVCPGRQVADGATAAGLRLRPAQVSRSPHRDPGNGHLPQQAERWRAYGWKRRRG